MNKRVQLGHSKTQDGGVVADITFRPIGILYIPQGDFHVHHVYVGIIQIIYKPFV